jgi:hypothetical protein
MSARLGGLAKELQAERDALREALVEYAEHGSWRCEHAPHYYLTDEGRADIPEGDCPCGLDGTLRKLGLHPDRP